MKLDIFQELLNNNYKDMIDLFIFIFRDYYFSYKFYNIIPDNRTASILSVENHKFKYYKKNLFIKLDIIITKTNHIKFNK
jgi:hypothetical protein